MAFNELGFIYEGLYAVCAAHYSTSNLVFENDYEIINLSPKTTLDGGYNKNSILETLKFLSNNVEEYTGQGLILTDNFLVKKKGTELTDNKYLRCKLKIKLPKGTIFFAKNKKLRKSMSYAKEEIFNFLINRFPSSIISNKIKNTLISYVEDEMINLVEIHISTTGNIQKIKNEENNINKLLKKSDLVVNFKTNKGYKLTSMNLSEEAPSYKLNQLFNILSKDSLLDEIEVSLKLTSSSSLNKRIHNTNKKQLYKDFGYSNNLSKSFDEILNETRSLWLSKLQYFLFGISIDNIIYNSLKINIVKKNINLDKNQKNYIKEFSFNSFIDYMKKLNDINKLSYTKKENSYNINYNSNLLYQIKFIGNDVKIEISSFLIKELTNNMKKIIDSHN